MRHCTTKRQTIAPHWALVLTSAPLDTKGSLARSSPNNTSSELHGSQHVADNSLLMLSFKLSPLEPDFFVFGLATS